MERKYYGEGTETYADDFRRDREDFLDFPVQQIDLSWDRDQGLVGAPLA